MENFNYLSIDPSGSGTTGIFFWNNTTKEEYFATFKSKDWKDHFLFLMKICEEKKINLIIYETTNFIKIRGSDLTSLFKIFGAIESLPHVNSKVISCKTVFVRDVKLMQKKIKENALEMKNLFFRAGRGGGWFRKEKKISTHEVDAFLILYLYFKKNYPDFNLD